MTKADFASLQLQVKILALNVGLRAAARSCGLDEARVRKWSSRGKWGISAVHPVCFRQPTVSPDVTPPHEAITQIIQHYGDRAKIGATIAGSKALEHLADCEPHKLVAPCNAIAADQWTKAVDRAAGWTQSRAQGVTVNVANIIPPTEAERSDRKAIHAQLDEITRLLAS